MLGKSGDDTFVFAKDYDQHLIGDFTSAGPAAADVIRLLSFGAAFNTFAELMAAVTQNGSNTVIDFGGAIRSPLPASARYPSKQTIFCSGKQWAAMM